MLRQVGLATVRRLEGITEPADYNAYRLCAPSGDVRAPYAELLVDGLLGTLWRDAQGVSWCVSSWKTSRSGYRLSLRGKEGRAVVGLAALLSDMRLLLAPAP